MKRGDFWSGLVLAALGAWIVYTASGWDYLTPEGPGAGFFPLWYGIAMLVLAIVLVGQALRRATTATQAGAPAVGARSLAVAVALAVTVALLKPFGFAVSLALLTFFLALFIYRRRWPVAMTTAVCMSAVFYFIFVFALNVDLPAGPWGF